MNRNNIHGYDNTVVSTSIYVSIHRLFCQPLISPTLCSNYPLDTRAVQICPTQPCNLQMKFGFNIWQFSE